VPDNLNLLNKLNAGHYKVVLASLQILLVDGSHFCTTTVRKYNCTFSKRLEVNAIDEGHFVWGWREFRKVSWWIQWGFRHEFKSEKGISEYRLTPIALSPNPSRYI
jgi:hypothetical protein